MIEVSNIRFSYGRRTAPVFEDFSLSLREGCIYGLLGKNGTGKSTLLYMMSGLLFPQAGEVIFDGNPVAKRSPEVLEDIFLVPEEFDLPAMRLSKYVRINAPFYPHFSDEILYECLKSADIRLGELSMGQKKKAFMSFALATNTRLLLMDEPTNGLDIPSKSQFRKVVARHMNDSRTLVISTHQVRDVDMLLDHVAIIDGKRLLLNRSIADICSRLRFEERPVGADVSDALYIQPSLQGNAVICHNEKDDDTPLNLELLFNALQENAASLGL